MSRGKDRRPGNGHTRRQVGAPAGAAPRTLPPQLPPKHPAQAATNLSSNLSDGSQFPPGEPLLPTPGLTSADGGPRQWSYPVGWNIGWRPRASEQTTFEALRNLAALYDGIQLCERVYFDLLGRLELRVIPRADLLADGEDPRAPRWRDPALAIEDFLGCPDRTQDLRSWLVAFVRDLLEIDAVAVYRRRDRAGRLYGLELVAGETIKPLLEAGGRTPQPPGTPYKNCWYAGSGGAGERPAPSSSGLIVSPATSSSA